MIPILPGRGVSVYLPATMSIFDCAEYLERFSGLNVMVWAYYRGHRWYVLHIGGARLRNQVLDLDKKRVAKWYDSY